MNTVINSPLISVVIPTYNRAEFIADAINSVLAQTYSNIELIVIDDGSTDSTEKIVKRYDSIQYIKIDNQGVGNARNTGILHAKGEYLAFLDSDDKWLSNKLELQLAHYYEHPNAGIIVGSCGYINREGNDTISPQSISPQTISNEELEIFSGLPGGPCNVLIKKSVLEDIGGFDASLLRSQDRELWMRISRKYPVFGIQDVTCLVRIHDTPRYKINLDVIKDSRIEVNSRIRDKNLKRKADAWMYFYFFSLHYNKGEILQALHYLLISFITYPLNIHQRCKRFRQTAEIILPTPVYKLLSFIKTITSKKKQLSLNNNDS